jgi:hypothetical protein
LLLLSIAVRTSLGYSSGYYACQLSCCGGCCCCCCAAAAANALGAEDAQGFLQASDVLIS